MKTRKFGGRAALLVLWVAALLVASLPMAMPAHAATFTAKNQGDDVDKNPGDGKCDAPGIFQGCTLRAAIMELNALGGGTVVLEPLPAIYTLKLFGPGEDLARTGDLDIRTNINFVVEGIGTAVIRGTTGWNDRIFHVRPGATVSMDHLIIERGAPNAGGGAVRVEPGGSLTLNRSTVQASAATGVGGGIFNNGGILTLGFSTVQGNRAATDGGGIFSSGKLALNNSLVLSNRATNNGAGIANSGTASLVRSDIRGNNGSDFGGGLFNGPLGSLNLAQVTVDSNTTAPGARGGGIYNEGRATISRSTISRNEASTAGGVENFGTSAILELKNSTISSNRAVSGPGGIRNFSGASADSNNVTIAFNVAVGGEVGAGGVQNDFATFLFENSIIAKNEAPAGTPSDCGGALTSSGFNLVGVNSSCFAPATGDKVGFDPLLGPLRGNGGFTETHAFTGASAAIDGGNPAPPEGTKTECERIDQDGKLRPIDGNGDGVPVCDIGAFELSPVGTFALEPTFATITFGEEIPYTLTWRVPESGTWRDLDTLELRIRDDQGEIIRVCWEEDTNELSLFDEKAGKCGPGFAPGSPNKLQTNEATLHLDGSDVVGSGTTGQTVTLMLMFSFKPQAAGRTYEVQVAATDDAGQREDFVSGADLTVLPR